MPSIRQYTPAIGTLLKLKLWEHYTALIRQHEAEGKTSYPPHVWGWFKVEAWSTMTGAELRVCNGNVETGTLVTVPCSQVAPPFGWAPTYTIICKDEAQAKLVVASWFTRESTSGPTTICPAQPAEAKPSPQSSPILTLR